jgi:hypothetical protein
MADSCERGNETSSSVNGGVFPDQPRLHTTEKSSSFSFFSRLQGTQIFITVFVMAR